MKMGLESLSIRYLVLGSIAKKGVKELRFFETPRQQRMRLANQIKVRKCFALLYVRDMT